MKPLISVIVPLFKTEAYLEKCLDSIAAQTFENYEVLCIDDCSPDNSIQIVERFARTDSRVRLIRHEKNLGLGGARNTGIREARADYIASVDSDDYIEPEMLGALWEGTCGEYFDVVVCGYVRVDEQGKVLSKHMLQAKSIDPLPPDQNPFKVSNPAFWNKLWRRSLFVDNDIYFPNHIYFQDAATTPRIYTKAQNVNFVGGVLYNYLVRGDSVTNSFGDKHLLDKFRELDTVKDFLIKENLYESREPHFHGRITDGFKYHSSVFSENNANPDAAADQYLRHLLMMREAYAHFDDSIRALTTREKIEALARPAGSLNRKSSHAANGASVASRSIPDKPRVLVLTMFCGENEYERSKASLHSQVYTNWSQICLENLGNFEAHQKLYGTIMERRHESDLFVKLDADMLFANPTVLDQIVHRFKSDPLLDHLVTPCFDFMTGKSIIGVHTFSNRVSWTSAPDGIFLDPNPSRPGKRKILDEPSSPMFLHSPDPSEFQAFHFGAHRALKLAQPGRSAQFKRSEAIQTQWDILYHVWQRFVEDLDRRHGLALIAAHLVFTRTLSTDVHECQCAELIEAFNRHKAICNDALYDKLRQYWETSDDRRRYFNFAVGKEGLKRIEMDRQRASKPAPKPSSSPTPAPKPSSSPAPVTRVNGADLSKANGSHPTWSGTKRAIFLGSRLTLAPFLDEKDRKRMHDNPIEYFKKAKWGPNRFFGRLLLPKSERPY